MNTPIKLSDNSFMPILGQGTWGMGENSATKGREVEALQHGINKGLNLIDTAEMYGDAESVVGEAIQDLDRSKLYIVSKVLPNNAGRGKVFDACNRSLRKLGTDHLDLYLLHWRGSVPLSETVECMEELVKIGKIKRWGVSNFDLADMKELWTVKNGNKCVVNQVLYHLGSRGIEYDLLPWMKQNQVITMAYCPIAQGGSLRTELLSSPVVKEVANKYNITSIQLLLAFILNQKNIVTIPKSSTPAHITQNSETLKVILDNDDIEFLNTQFPAPQHKTHLDIV